MPDAHAIPCGVLARHRDADMGVGQPFERIKRLSNCKVGDVGQDFVEALCNETGFACEFPVDARGKRLRTHPRDVRIEGRTLELKTAAEDVGDAFQFNHIRYRRPWEGLLCIGIGPAALFMGAWSKADVATGKAGHLVSMDKGSSATHKLSKRPDQLRAIAEFEDAMLDLLASLDG